MHDYVIIGGGIVDWRRHGCGPQASRGEHSRPGKGAGSCATPKWPKQRCHPFGHLLQAWKSESQVCAGSNRSMVEFCREHGIRHEVCGKVIVATKASELPLLDNLFNAASITGSLLRGSRRTSTEIEPHVRALPASKFRRRQSSTTGKFLRNMLNRLNYRVEQCKPAHALTACAR